VLYLNVLIPFWSVLEDDFLPDEVSSQDAKHQHRQVRIGHLPIKLGDQQTCDPNIDELQQRESEKHADFYRAAMASALENKLDIQDVNYGIREDEADDFNHPEILLQVRLRNVLNGQPQFREQLRNRVRQAERGQHQPGKQIKSNLINRDGNPAAKRILHQLCEYIVFPVKKFI